MKTLIVIPARFASTRLPGKPLLADTGKPLIQHSYEQAKKSSADEVIVATDDQRIYDCVTGFGGKVVMTSPDHETGSSRVGEVADSLKADIIVNMQGDEPEIDPAHLNLLLDIQKQNSEFFASTLVCPFPSEALSGHASPNDPDCVKAVLGKKFADNIYEALYFSRSLVPYPRVSNGQVDTPEQYYLHIGLYAFTPASLKQFNQMPMGQLEQLESLEQLRILEAGHKMGVGLVATAAPGIDTPEDYAKFLERHKS
ncbi:MAG: 3-deoxy-manno-octulosonate cytidylyltransferase [bacterium]